jgi:hypothetical protein
VSSSSFRRSRSLIFFLLGLLSIVDLGAFDAPFFERDEDAERAEAFLRAEVLAFLRDEV